MKISDLVVKCLETEGVKYIFGLPGEEIEDLLFSIEKSPVKFIPTRLELGASFMADVYGWLIGKELCLVEIPIQPSVNNELSQKLKRDLY